MSKEIVVGATRTMTQALSEGVFLCVHGQRDPSDIEWEELLAFHRAKARYTTRMLVVTRGGGPNAKQRAKLNEYTKGIPMIVAVCTEVAIVRGIVKAINLFNPRVEAFSVTNIADALRYLGVEVDRVPRVQAEVNRLLVAVGGHA